MKASRKTKSIIAVSSVLLLLAAGLVVGKNILLRQVKGKIESSFGYSRLEISAFPPALVLEDVRTLSPEPFFSAKRVVIEISYLSLLSKAKPFRVFIDEPFLRLGEGVFNKGKEGGKATIFPLPFAIERGVVRGGELNFVGAGESLEMRGISAIFSQKEDTLLLRAESEENILSLDAGRKRIQGKLDLWVEGKGRQITIKRIRANGPDFVLRAEGRLTNPENPRLQLKTSLNIPISLAKDVLQLPFDWEGQVEGEGVLVRDKGGLVFDTSVSCPRLTLNRVVLGPARGRVRFGAGAGHLEVDILRGGLPDESVAIDFSGEKLEGTAKRFHLDPIMNYMKLPWPVKSPVWGNFSLIGGKLVADGEFRDESAVPTQNRYPLRGQLRLNWDGGNDFSFSSPALHSSFADVELKGRVSVDRDVDIEIRGDVGDVREARMFTSLLLQEEFDVPEIRGKGQADVRIFGAYLTPRVTANFSLSPGGYDRFDVLSIEGAAEIYKTDLAGKFRVHDPSMNGEIGLIVDKDSLKVDLQLDQGNIEKILPGLQIQLPLTGKGKGKFEVSSVGDLISVRGDFSSPQITLSGQPLQDVDGRLEFKGETIAFPRLQFRVLGGVAQGSARLNLKTQEFGLDATAQKIPLSALSAAVKGDLSFGLKGSGSLGKDAASGQFKIGQLEVPGLQKFDALGTLKLGYSEKRISADINGKLLPGENEFAISLLLPVDGKPYSADIKGNFGDLDLLLPWKGSKGRLNYRAEVRQANGSPQVTGVIDFQGPLLPLPRFAHAVTDFSGLVFVQDNKASVRSFQAKLGGGDVKGSGEISLGKGGVETVDLRLEGKGLLLSPFERTRGLTDGTLRLVKDPGRFVLEGDFLFQKLSWRREAYEKFSFYSTPYYVPTEPSIFDDLTLNLHLRADDNAWIDNSLGRVRCRFDLSITGSVNAPLIMGDIEALGGDVYFQDRTFKVLKGRLSFFNPATLEPYLEFKGESFVKDYRVTFTLNGLISQLRPEFSSSPPLPPEDVLALLAMGESFKRTYSYDTSTRLSTASLLSFQIAEQAKKRAEGLFSLDRLRIDPFVLGSSAEMTARLTVGKKISRNFFILYSTNLTTQREELARMEWEISNDFSLVGTRDELGRISFDVKVRKRF